MRVFQTQSMWDKIEEQWYEVFSVDGEQCSQEEYFRELEVEQCLEDDEVEEEMNMEEIHDEDCTCQDCQENRKMIYLGEAVKFMFENQLCPKGVFELLGDIYDKGNYEGYEEGYEDVKNEMREFLDD